MIKQFIIRWAVNALGLWLAGELIEGVSYGDEIAVVIVAALVFSIINALIRPIAVLLSLPAIILTLGLFTLVINGFMLFLVTVIYDPFVIQSFGAALLAVIIIWIVNFAANTLIRE